MAEDKIPFCVDLDGTLIRTDTLHEALLSLIKRSPSTAARLPFWLFGGKAKFKHSVANRVNLDASTLPYCENVLALVEEARRNERPIVLVTAAPASIADSVAENLGFFTDVLSSDATLNLSHHRKADVLVSRYGAKGFDYVGNSSADLPVFQHSRRAFLASSSARLRRAAMRRNDDLNIIQRPRAGLRAWLRAIRAHQWLKNLLVFVPILAAGKFLDPKLSIDALVAFVSFSLLASAVYITNDLLDLESDRRHPTKRTRPFAGGAIQVRSGAILVPLLVGASLALAVLVPPLFLVVLLGYAVATTLYSFALKRQVIVDVMLLAALYTCRVLAGSAATNIRPSFWLLAFSMFVFLCLAMVKRYSELRQSIDRDEVLTGRGYRASDLPVVLALGSGSGLVSVLILALYTQSLIVPELYPAPEWIWLLPPLMLYWLARLWLKAGRGEVDDDPVVFAARDWQSRTVAIISAVLLLLSRSGWWPL